MSKDLFMLMREQEVQTANFLPNKKELELSSKKFAKDLLEKGEIDPAELATQAVRAKASISVMADEFVNALPREKQNVYGVEFTPVNGRKMLQYSDDSIWSDLNKKIKEREELLKVALGSDNEIYDSEGCEVPKVSVNYAKDSLAIKF